MYEVKVCSGLVFWQERGLALVGRCEDCGEEYRRPLGAHCPTSCIAIVRRAA